MKLRSFFSIFLLSGLLIIPAAASPSQAQQPPVMQTDDFPMEGRDLSLTLESEEPLENLDQVSPFDIETNYMSEVGFVRYALYRGTGVWIQDIPDSKAQRR